MTVRRILSISLVFAALSGTAAQDRGNVRTFQFRNVELRAALDSLLRWYAVPLIYLESDVAGKRVNAECRNCGFEEALKSVTEGQGLLWSTVGGQVVLRRYEGEEGESPVTLAGTIRDSLTGEGIIAADVLLLAENESSPTGESPSKVFRWCPTNQFGFFSLRNITPGTYVLHVRRLGYTTINETVTILPGSAMVRDIAIREKELVHPEVTVEGQRSVFSALPGISRGVYIRATPSDHNQYLLEGARIYNPLHVGGVMSTFNSDPLRDVQVVAGGVPPFYGGRIGGILDVVMRDGSQTGLAGSATVGSLSSNLLFEGPLSEQTSFVISGRRGYPDLFLPKLVPGETPNDLNSTEVMAKVTHHLSKDQKISLSGFLGQDTYGNFIARPAGNHLTNSLRWGNRAANLRWIGVVSPSLFFYASAIYTRYGFDVDHRLEGTVVNAGESFVSEYRIEDLALRAHAEYFYDEYHTVLAGVELSRHRLGGTISEFSSQIGAMEFDGFTPWELSVYFQDQWRLTPSVMAELGGRATSFVASQGSFSAMDPRFALLVTLREDLRIFSSLSAVNQFVHPYRHSGIFLFYPSIFLYPSTEEIKPSTSLQVSLGMEKSFREDQYRLTVESYYRMTHNLHEFVYDTTAAQTLFDALLVGEGSMYGAEVTLDKRLGAFTGSVRYGYSWATNRFDALNNGAPFRPRFDRRHELYLMASYAPHENWTIAAVALLSSNQFPSFAPGGVDADRNAAQDVSGPRASFESSYAEPFDLNGGRLPGFQRLELRLQHRFSSLGFPTELTLRLLNGYGLVDPFVWQVRENSDDRLRWNVTFDAPPLFPLYPVLSMSVRF
ncbi:MAG: TonB-dependent receptor [Bacteroidota bacterium]